MPYASTKQRGFIHAAAARGVKWAKKFVGEADKMPQPTKKYAATKAAKRKMKRG